MTVSKAIFAAVAVLAIVVGVMIGFLIGYFTIPKLTDCDGPQQTDGDANGVSRHIYNHAPGPCHLVDGVEHGSEDIEMLPSGRAIITSGMLILREFTRETWPKGIGRIKTFDFSRPRDGATDLTILSETLDLDIFNPHGISVYNDKSTGKVYVFVINHGYLPDMKEAIERFELDEDAGTLTHLESIVDDVNFKMLNNLVATGPSSFYFTNFLGTRVLSDQLADIMQHTASFGYYGDNSGRLLFEEQPASNGIHMSPDGRYVYVSQAADDMVSIYRRQENTDLVWVEDYLLHSLCDNVVAQGEYLWFGCHPDLSATMKYLSNPTEATSPSQVIRLKVADGHVTEEVEVFADDGRLFSGSTVALNHADGMLVGSVITKLLYCQIKYIG